MAERDVPSGLAALLVASVPLWVVLWRLVFRERVGVPALAGTALGLTGVGVLVWPTSGDVIAGASMVGVVLLVRVTLSYATGSFPSPRLAMPTDVFAVSAAQMLLAGAVLTVAGLVAGEARRVDFTAVTPASWWALAYLRGGRLRRRGRAPAADRDVHRGPTAGPGLGRVRTAPGVCTDGA